MKRLAQFLPVFLSVMVSVLGAETYHVQNLGTTFGSTNSYAHGVNDSGNIVGYFKDTNGTFRAFLLRSLDWSDLGVSGTNTYALSLNSSNHVVGYSQSTNGATAFHFYDTTLADLGPLGGISSYAFGINGQTNIVGYVDTTNGTVAILYSNGVPSNLGNLGGTNAYAFAINSSNLVVGSSLDSSNAVLNAFVWGSTGMTNLNDLLPLNSGWFLMEARSISSSGAIVGWGLTNGIEHAFLFAANSVTDLALLSGGTNSYGLSLNDSNVVVGASTTTGGVIHAFVWRDGQLHDLNDLVPPTSGWSLKEARGINNSGWIVGWGLLDGQEQAFLLLPNQRPNVAITSPTNNASESYPNAVTLTATASDPDGTVAKVEFFADAVHVGSDTNSPYSVTWTPSVAGVYSLSARATDDSGGETYSLVNTLNYSGPSTVAIVAPTNQSLFSFVTNINVSITATNPLSSITNIDLLIDGKLSNSTSNSPYAFDWPNPPAGAYTLTARAKDSGGFTGISLPVDVVVYQGWTGGGTNLAKNKTATQSSVGYSPASYAVDGGTNGNWYANSVSHTGSDSQAWWEVDLGSVEQIGGVRIWNRTDCCGSYLSNFYLLVSDNAFTSTNLSTVTNQSGVSSFYHAGAAGTQAALTVNRTGRYVRIQLTGTGYLQLAEVEVFGQSSAPPDAPGQLLAQSLSPEQVSLRWTNGVIAETKIERKNPGEERYHVIGVTPAGGSSFIDSGLTPNQTYTYRIRAGNNAGFSIYSNEASVTTDELGEALPLTNLELWLKADAGVTLSDANVATWLDQSGKSISVTQSNSSKQPSYVTNGFQNGPSVRFTGGKLLSHTTSNLLASGSARTFVFVGEADNSGSGGTILTFRRSMPLYWLLLGTFGGYHYTFTDGITAVNNAYGPSDLVTRLRDPFIAVQKTGGAGTKVGTSLSGNPLSITQSGSYPAETGSAGFTVGGTEVLSGYDWRGDIAEVLVFSRELNPTEQIVLERYLNRKYLIVPIPSVAELAAVALSESQAFISWRNSGMTTNTVLALERKTGALGSYAVVATLTNKSSFIDTGLLAGTTYFYRVKASHYFSGESAYSNEGTTTTPSKANWPLGNLNLWLRADQVVTSPVGLWEDLSWKGNHAIQATASYRPTLITNAANGWPALQFDGSNDTIQAMKSPGTNSFTVLAVTRTALGHEIDVESQTGWPGNSGQRYLLSCTPYGPSDPGLNYTNAGANLSVGTNGISYYNLQRIPVGTLPNLAEAVFEGPVGSGFNLIECSVTDGVASLFLNGTFVRTGLQSQRKAILAPVHIGGYAYGYFQGEIAEVMAFDRILSLEEKQSIYAYLNGRYAIAADPPDAPMGLAATGVSPTQVSLVWTNSGNSAVSVHIERKTGSLGIYEFVAALPAASTSFLDGSLTGSTEYFYRIRAENLAGYSSYSSEAAASTLSIGSSIPISGITLWLKADGASRSSLNPNSYVNKWLDESGRRNHAFQSSGSQQPIWGNSLINGRPALRFDGTNDMLRVATSPGTNDFTIFVVARPEESHEVDVELSSSSNPAFQGQRYVVACGTDFETINSFFTNGTGGTGLSLGTNGLTLYEFQQNAIGGQSSMSFVVYENHISPNASLYGLVVGSRSAAVYIDGALRRTSTGSLRSTEYAPVHIGGFAATANGYHKGEIAEILIFNGVLSQSERRSVETYLNSKYALVTLVPSAPFGLLAQSVSLSQISLTWDTASTNSLATYYPVHN